VKSEILQVRYFAWHRIGLQNPDSKIHRFSKCSVQSPRAPREKPRGSASYSFTYYIFLENLLWDSLNYGQSLHGLHITKSLRTPAVHHWLGACRMLVPIDFVMSLSAFAVMLLSRKLAACDVITYPWCHCDINNDVTFPEVW